MRYEYELKQGFSELIKTYFEALVIDNLYPKGANIEKNSVLIAECFVRLINQECGHPKNITSIINESLTGYNVAYQDINEPDLLNNRFVEILKKFKTKLGF